MTFPDKTAADMEPERIELLRKYEILDTPPDGTFDNLTRFASQILKMPIAIVSLVDTDRIWFKSRYGMGIQEIPRDPGLCASAIYAEDFYLVEDAKNDPRTLANPLVAGEFGLGFYAAAPLKTKEGLNLGTFCVIDKRKRTFKSQQKQILQNFADLVMAQMELRMEARVAVRHQHNILNTTAHDLKNPLSIMPLLADMIIHNKDNPHAIADMAKQIKEAGKRMVKTVDNLLETAREESDNVQLRLRTMDFGSLIKGVIATNTALAKRKNQILEFKQENPCIVFADHRRMTDVVDNLMNNAIKYSPYGTTISIFLRIKNNHARMEVADEGPGLSQDDRKNLFRQFTSLSAQPTGGETSTGLGLYISKNVVEAHRGVIFASDEVKEKGTTFVVEIPLSEK